MTQRLPEMPRVISAQSAFGLIRVIWDIACAPVRLDALQRTKGLAGAGLTGDVAEMGLVTMLCGFVPSSSSAGFDDGRHHHLLHKPNRARDPASML